MTLEDIQNLEKKIQTAEKSLLRLTAITEERQKRLVEIEKTCKALGIDLTDLPGEIAKREKAAEKLFNEITESLKDLEKELDEHETDLG